MVYPSQSWHCNNQVIRINSQLFSQQLRLTNRPTSSHEQYKKSLSTLKTLLGAFFKVENLLIDEATLCVKE